MASAYDFNKEEEVKEFLDNLGIEYRFNCFNEKIPESCQLLGEYLETIRVDHPKALKVFHNNCEENNHPKSCFRYAYLNASGKGCKASTPEALKYYSRSCDLGSKEGCTHGALFMLKESMNKDVTQATKDDYFKKSIPMLQKGCDLGKPYACSYLSGLYITGKHFGLEKDMQKARELCEKGCDLEEAPCCANLSQMYQRGDGVEVDKEKALFYRTKAKKLQETTPTFN